MQATESIVDRLNSLLRGEIAATETYNQALEKIRGDACEGSLRQIRDDHREVANTWRQHVHQFGGKPDQGSGTWGFFAKAVEGTAKQFGKKAAMKALIEGETAGLRDYEAALEQRDLPAECQTLVRTQISATQAHVRTLEALSGKCES